MSITSSIIRVGGAIARGAMLLPLAPNCILTLLTLAELEEARRENGWTEEPEEDGTTDQLEAGILSLCPKPLT